MGLHVGDGLQLTTPRAILAGSVIIALGLFFGLRGREPEPPAPSPPALPPASSAPPPLTSSGTSRATDATSARPPADVAAATKAASDALERHKKAATDACWDKAAPGSVRYLFNIDFGPDGKQTGRGITEPREGARPGVVNCLQLKIPSLEIAPPGEAVAVEVPLTLP